MVMKRENVVTGGLQTSGGERMVMNGDEMVMRDGDEGW